MGFSFVLSCSDGDRIPFQGDNAVDARMDAGAQFSLFRSSDQISGTYAVAVPEP